MVLFFSMTLVVHLLLYFLTSVLIAFVTEGKTTEQNYTITVTNQALDKIDSSETFLQFFNSNICNG